MIARKKNPIKLYLDACVYIGISTEETNVILQEYWQAVLASVKEEQAKIMASSLMLDEVYQIGIEDNIDTVERILHQKKLIIPLGVNKAIRDGARDLIKKSKEYNKRNQSTVLQYNDAIHLQTALSFGAHEFHTFDKQIIKLNPEIWGNTGLVISSPMESNLYSSLKKLVLSGR